jgi:hypothetical protein
MSWTQGRLAQVRAVGEQAGVERQYAKSASEAVKNNADALREMVVSELEKIVSEFREGLPAAQTSDLRVERLNANNLTISTRVYPILRLEIIYHPGFGVDGEIRKIYSGLEPAQVARLSMIRFAVDPLLRPWFTDGEHYLHPTQVAEELMEEVAKFFEDAATRPVLVG